MRLLLDMNLSPTWLDVLRAEGWETTHWSEVRAASAPDVQIMSRAKENHCCVLTNDLDFSAILAATRAEGPSVVQIRAQHLAPATLAPVLIRVLDQYRDQMAAGAILTLDARGARVRALPLS